jgi:hypothetical protein
VIELTKTRTAMLAIAGVVVAALLGWMAQSLTAEKVVLSGASADAGYELAPNGANAKKAASKASNDQPVVAEVGSDGKVHIVSGQGSAAGAGAYKANNADAAKWDD